MEEAGSTKKPGFWLGNLGRESKQPQQQAQQAVNDFELVKEVQSSSPSPSFLCQQCKQILHVAQLNNPNRNPPVQDEHGLFGLIARHIEVSKKTWDEHCDFCKQQPDSHAPRR